LLACRLSSLDSDFLSRSQKGSGLLAAEKRCWTAQVFMTRAFFSAQVKISVNRGPVMYFANFAKTILSQLKWLVAIAIMVAPLHSGAQIAVGPNTEGNTSGANCSLQEAIYATEFGSNIALDQTDPDDTYNTGCSDPSGAWNTIVLPGGTLKFTKFWDGDAHNPFGPTATPIIFKAITIQGNGTTLQYAWTAASPTTRHFRLFAVGEASISPTSGVLTSGTYSGTGNLTLQNVYITGFNVKGGDGAGGGGGGLGAGGAIYVGSLSSGVVSLTVQNSTFANNSATGGNGGGGSFGGGGGLNGNGGHSTYPAVGGGGGGGARGDGGDSGLNACAPNDYRCESGGGGGGTVFSGGNATGDPNNNEPGPGGYLCGGSGGGPGVIHNGFVTNIDGQDGTCPGGGGGGGAYNNYFLGGDGVGGSGAYGGGGAGGPKDGGNGGFGGGGGDSSGGICPVGGTCGHGGFGGGGADGEPGGKFGGNGGACTGSHDCGGGGGGALGGSIFNASGTVVIQNSTFYGNAVLRGVGGDTGVDNGGDGGGAIFTYHGSLTVQNSTISGNAASGAGGGIETVLNGTFVLQNTIIANNGAQECITGGFVNTAGSAANLITNNFDCTAVTLTSDPQLEPLQVNSPGNTPTMAIQYGVSPAIDAGDDSTALATDQRGVTRPQGAHSDIGAYEAPPPSADLSITKGISSSTAQPGDTITYTLTVRNAGPNTANNVSVSDTLPTSYLTFVSCTENTGTGTCTYSGGTVSVTYASMAASASSTVTINTTVNTGATDGVSVGNNASVSASDPTDPNTANNTSANVFFTVHNKADLAVTKSVSSTSPYWPATGIEVGDPLTYTITLTNKGPYDAKSVVLSDSAPAGVTFTGCAASVGTCVWSSSSASLSLSSFTNASVATLTIQAKLNFGVADGSTITNTGSVTSTTNDPDPTNNASSASFTALNKADLFLTQSVGKLMNQQLTYTVTVKNLGPYQAKQLLLNDAMPNGAKFVSVAAGPWTCTPLPLNSTGTLSCTVSTLTLNATDSLSFTVKVTTTGKNITNTATVGAATFDPNLANNTATLLAKSGAGK
jgi:uncharacterized repeat protein (TIGR01451 family)